mgnify:CR=1 FL=1
MHRCIQYQGLAGTVQSGSVGATTLKVDPADAWHWIIYQLAWDATPICKFVLDFPIMNFCVSDSDDTMICFNG